ncbi:peptidylprolyl isomerase [Chroococcidiopsis sp. FACHB-1243]|uniref:peptidylprolyl isomerase n=1 Tax=Chroococcidiopsis sp. [FACHB-1243] TaxID=2692781 RepID=UPI00178397D0|nr:peptidylprolyl isomerase [Chroococcidiopsis sp. [FACHB-1243]]MBD2307358.1 peptidylprolyl isomerase [Chroococcidiopsis sp. [FACHB-1243]]
MAQEFQLNSIIPTQEIPSLLSRYQLLPQLMRGIAIDRAIAPYFCTEAERQQAIEHFERQYHINAPESRAAWLKRAGMSEAQMAEVAVRSLLIEKFKQDTWSAKVESYFMSRKAAFDQAIFSLLRTTDGLLAQEIYFRILEGEQTFAEMAQQYSKGSEANTAGVIGPVPLSQLNPTLAKILSIGQPGQLWRPTRIENWFTIVRLEKLLPAQLDANMRQRLLNEMFETWLNEQIQQLEPLQFSWS